jgi:hypothetical protein
MSKTSPTVLSVEEIMDSDFTQNPEPKDSREFLDLFWIVSPQAAPYRTGGCEHHVREFVRAARGDGSAVTFYWFISAYRFCGVCSLLEVGHPNPYLPTQLAFAVTRPGQDEEELQRVS